MTILVTGANGGFGKVFVPWLKMNYNETVIGSGRSAEKYENYIECDLADESSVHSLIEAVKPRLIFHLAGGFSGNFNNDVKINALSAMHIFESLTNNQLNSRVVVLGSAAEYGVVLPSDNPVPESFVCKPVSVYGTTKLIQTEISSYYAREKGLDIVIARVFNLATPGLSTRLFYGRAEAQISSYLKGEIDSLQFGNLDSARDYIGFEEVVMQLKAVADYGVSAEVYNVGTGVAKKIRDVLREMLDEKGVHDAKIVESVSLSDNATLHDVPIIYADVTKIKKLMANSIIDL